LVVVAHLCVRDSVATFSRKAFREKNSTRFAASLVDLNKIG
jgi:hypothetical protein